tara:strand:- start:2776 stop:2901 length:126 start_codon:yes stop_codon:yes gene_type:complete
MTYSYDNLKNKKKIIYFLFVTWWAIKIKTTKTRMSPRKTKI